MLLSCKPAWTAPAMLHFYSWMKADSIHHDYMCLVTVHSRNFTVWRRKWIPCGSGRGAGIVSLGKVSRGESHPSSWMLPVRGFSNSLLQLSSGEKFWRKRLTQLWQLKAPSDCITFTLSLHGGKMQSCWRCLTTLRLHWIKSIWGAKGHILATVSVTYTCHNLKQLIGPQPVFSSDIPSTSPVFYTLQNVWSSFASAFF